MSKMICSVERCTERTNEPGRKPLPLPISSSFHKGANVIGAERRGNE